MRRGVATALVALGCVLLAGGSAAGQAGSPGATIEPLLVIRADARGGVEVDVRLEGVGLPPVGAVAGELRYDTSRAALADAWLPGPMIGRWSEEPVGTVRFAAASPAGTDAGAVVTLRFRLRGELDPGAFRLRVTEAFAAADARVLTAHASPARTRVIPATSRP